MNIAIQNIHLLPNLNDLGIHNYILELVRRGHIKYLYFEENTWIRQRLLKRNLHNNINIQSLIDSNKIEIITTEKQLNSHCDVLLNFNTHTKEHDFTRTVKNFNGLKIWHVGDYFWNEPASDINNRYKNFGIDYIFGYSRHDKYCEYFKKSFPTYIGKVIHVPFGFQNRFRLVNDYKNRINKCVGLGSVNPLRPLEYEASNYIESANFFPDEAWFHKFRRLLIINKNIMKNQFDSMLPVFPQIKDFTYDLVQKFNQYRMFVSCESIFHFPPAKFFEGPACGAALICADTGCNKEYGFKEGINCIMYEEYNIQNFIDKVKYYQKHSSKLLEIQKNGHSYVTSRFSHELIADHIAKEIHKIKY